MPAALMHFFLDPTWWRFMPHDVIGSTLPE
jgi:hypothetical protein